MSQDMMKKVPVSEQDPKVRAKNFEEVCLGYSEEEAVLEAQRCLNCKNAQCVLGCPVSIRIPAFIQAVKARDFHLAGDIIAESSALPSICGRVCPQETQCEGKCIRGIKGEAVSIGKLHVPYCDQMRPRRHFCILLYATRFIHAQTIVHGEYFQRDLLAVLIQRTPNLSAGTAAAFGNQLIFS